MLWNYYNTLRIGKFFVGGSMHSVMVGEIVAFIKTTRQSDRAPYKNPVIFKLFTHPAYRIEDVLGGAGANQNIRQTT